MHNYDQELIGAWGVIDKIRHPLSLCLGRLPDKPPAADLGAVSLPNLWWLEQRTLSVRLLCSGARRGDWLMRMPV